MVISNHIEATIQDGLIAKLSLKRLGAQLFHGEAMTFPKRGSMA